MKFFYLVLFISLLSSVQGQLPMDWNVGTGGNNSRYCLSTSYGPQNPTLLWNETLYAKRGYQTYIDGAIIVASRRHSYTDPIHGAKIVAHDLHSGDTLWTAELPVQDPDNENFSQVKGLKNGHVYGSRADGINQPSPLYALDIETGELEWQSEALMTTSFSEDLSYAENGDIIIGNYYEIIRVNYETGDIIWSADKVTPSSDGGNVAVYEDRCYVWEASPSGPKISTFKLATGEYLYSSDAVSAGLVQQTGLFVGPDGTIYTPRTQNNPITDFFVSYTDTGNEIVENWRIPYGYAIWASSAVGPDGTIYTYNTDGEVVRLDPLTGDILNTSEQIINAFPAGPKMAVGADGILYITNGEYGNEKLYSFDSDLTTRWIEEFTNNVIEGPSLAYDGTLVVCSGGTEMRVYEGNPVPQLFPEFIADSVMGVEPFTVNFTDLSQSIYTNITDWAWDFDGDDIIDSYDQNPTFTFPETGFYTVSLTISDGSISQTITKEDYITVVICIGIAKSEININISPNPFSNSLSIKSQSSIDKIELLNTNGDILAQKPCFSNFESLANLDHLPAGLYTLRIISENAVVIRKIIKQ